VNVGVNGKKIKQTTDPDEEIHFHPALIDSGAADGYHPVVGTLDGEREDTLAEVPQRSRSVQKPPKFIRIHKS